MNHDIFIDQQHLILEDGQEFMLEYYITQKLANQQDKMYGIRVEKRGIFPEEETTGPISNSMEWVLDICKKIAECKVTPIGLINVVDDIMA